MSKITIEELVKRCNEVQWTLAKTLDQLSDQQKVAKPSPSAWSILEVVTHLNLTFDHYFPKIETALERVQPAEIEFYKRSFMVGLFSDWQKPKNGKRKMKTKTFDFLQPEQKGFDNVEKEFLNNQDKFCAMIKKGRSHDISAIKVDSAIGSMLRFTLPECFDFLLSHEERHLNQIKQVAEKVS